MKNEISSPAGQGSHSEALGVLRDARALVAKGWCQESFAKKGEKLAYWTDADADRFCVAGAINKAAHDSGSLDDIAWGLLREAIGGISPIAWQDRPGRTQTEVLAAIDKAIALASVASAPKGAY